jgi:NADH-ubiquinone oxidoreductase chain 5
MVLKLGGQTTKVLDKGSIELIGPYGLEKGLLSLSRKLSKLDTGVITSYALYILVGFLFSILIPYLLVIDNNLLIIMLIALISLAPSEISYSDTTYNDNKVEDNDDN